MQDEKKYNEMETNEIESIVLQRMSAVNRQQAKELWTKPVPEVKYLNADNVSRYRLIMRYFYENHKKMRSWLRPEDVFAGVMRWGLLEEYSLEQCQRDLEVLTEWKNLTSQHDGGRASTIEEYVRKRYRYQMTPYAIEIERMLDNLENIQGYGGSLEPSLLERLAGMVTQIAQRREWAEGEALGMWRDVQHAFRQLHENASDYLASLQTAKAEELMMTESFLVFKDTLTNYLRNFIINLQRHGSVLEGLLTGTAPSVWESFIAKVVDDEERMPVLDQLITREERVELRREEWAVFVQWFAGNGREPSDMVYLERAAKDTISRVLKCALVIQEKHRWGVSRKKELDYLGRWFLKLERVEEAHKLAAFTFGLFSARHFQGEDVRTSDSAEMSMWEEEPRWMSLKPRVRGRRKAGETEAVREHREQKQKSREAIMADKAVEEEIMRRWIGMGEFRMSDLPEMTAWERRILLTWISRCVANRSRKIRTPDGLEILLKEPEGNRRTSLRFDDGVLDMPDFGISVKEVGGR